MPKVPEEQTPTFNTTNVPGVQFPFRQEFGKQGRALQEVGQQMENVSTEYADIQNRIRMTQNISTSSDAATQFKLDSDAKRVELNNASPDGYVYDSNVVDEKGHPTPVYNEDGVTRQTTADAYHMWVKDRYVQDQDRLGDNDAKAMYREKARTYGADSLMLMQHDVQTKRVDAADKGLETQLANVQDRVVSNPDLVQVYGHAQDFALQMKQFQSAGLHTGPEVQAMGLKLNAALADSAVQGGWSQEILNNRKAPGAQTAAINKWVSVLNGTDQLSVDRKAQGLPTISDMMNPEKKAIELDKLERYRVEAKKADLTNENHYIKDLTAGMHTGRESPERAMPQIISMLHNGVASGNRQAGEAGQLFSEAAAAGAFGQSSKSMRGMPPEAMYATATKAANNIIAPSHEFAKSIGFPAEAAGEPERNHVMQELDSLIKEEIARREKDPAGYIAKPDKDNRGALSQPMAAFSTLDANRPVNLSMNGNPGIAQAAFRDADSQYEAMHLPLDKRRYLPGEESGSRMNAGTLAHSLKDPSFSNEASWNNFRAIKTMSGKWSPQIINEMIADNKLGAEWGLMANVGTKIDPRSGAQMVAALRTPNSMMDRLIETDGADVKNFDQAVAKKVTNWAQGQEQANPFSLGNHNFQDAAIKGVGNLAKMFYHENMRDQDAAIEKAYATFVGENTTTVETGPKGMIWGVKTNGYANFPKTLHDGSPFTDQMSVNTVHYMADKMSEESIAAIKPAVPPGADESQKANFPAYVASHQPRIAYLYRNGEESVGISYVGPKGRELLMMDSKGVTPYSVPLSQAKQGPPPSKRHMDFSINALMQGLSMPAATGGFPIDPNK